MDFYALNYSFATLCLVAAVCFMLGRWSKSDGPARYAKPIGEVRTAKPHAKRNRQMRTASPSPARYAKRNLSGAAAREVEDLLSHGSLIAAIKVVRKDLGIGLKDAKDLVDDLRRNM